MVQIPSWIALMESATNTNRRQSRNKGKIVGQKVPFKVKDIWALRVRLQMEERVRELALFNLGNKSDPRLVYRIKKAGQTATVGAAATTWVIRPRPRGLMPQTTPTLRTGFSPSV
jgi:hypothetical protein